MFVRTERTVVAIVSIVKRAMDANARSWIRCFGWRATEREQNDSSLGVSENVPGLIAKLDFKLRDLTKDRRELPPHFSGYRV